MYQQGTYYVYILTNWNHKVMYIGVTSNLHKRIYQHKNKLMDGFTKKYTDNDIILLAKTDELHDTPCGHAVKKLCERAHDVFDDKAYRRLTEISVSHLYNLRDSSRYKRQRRTFTKTKSKQIAIGERRKPYPEGKPGYIRIELLGHPAIDNSKFPVYTENDQRTHAFMERSCQDPENPRSVWTQPPIITASPVVSAALSCVVKTSTPASPTNIAGAGLKSGFWS